MANWTAQNKNTSSYSNQSKNSSSFTNQSKSTLSTVNHFLIDNAFYFLIDSIYKLNIGGSGSVNTIWGNATKH